MEKSKAKYGTKASKTTRSLENRATVRVYERSERNVSDTFSLEKKKKGCDAEEKRKNRKNKKHKGIFAFLERKER